MGIGYLLHHSEAEAGAAVHAAGAVGLPEALPDVGQVLFVYSYAVIRACIPLNKGRVALIIYSVFGFLISSYYLRDVIEISTLNSYTLPIYLVAMAICTPLFFWISYKQGAFQKA